MYDRFETQKQNEPRSPTLKPKDKDHLNSLIGKRISLKVLQWLQEHMQPHEKPFSIIDIALILQNYVQRQLKTIKDPKQDQYDELALTALIPALRLQKKMSDNHQQKFQLKHDQTLQFLLEQIRTIFVYWGRNALNYEMINEYVYNQQLRSLYSQDLDEDYMETGEKRIRIDENLKLCILPIANFDQSIPNNRNRDIIFRQNKLGSEPETVYAVTRDSVRALHIRTELIGIASDYERKGSNNSCWYSYEKQCIKPKKETILTHLAKHEERALTSAQSKQIRATKMTNLQQMIPSHRLQILKAQVCNSSMGIICMDQSFLVQPLGLTNSQGYIGNLIRDIPPVVAYKGSKDVYEQILKLHCFSDNSWLIITTKFIYQYQIPSPSQNLVLYQQNNTSKTNFFKQNPLLLLCQRLPSGCISAEILGSKHVALMLLSNCIVIVELVINNRGILVGNSLRPSDNYYKITNKIYNDIQFKAICYNPTSKYLFLSDFGAFIIRLTFSPNHGDIQEQGPMHDKEENQQLNRQLIKNSYIQLKASRARQKQNTILQMDEQYAQTQEPYIQVYYIKGAKERQQQHLLSLYKKQNKSPHTVIIKNQSRQNITLIATSSHYNTLITYQSQSFQKSAMGESEGEKYREWGNQNKVKLWDARHMTIYQTLDITIQASCIYLRSNGLYFLTTEKGYLGFYQFNEEKKLIISKTEQMMIDKQNKEVVDELGEDIILEGGTLFYTTCVSTYNKLNNVRTHRTYLSSCNLEKYPESLHLQTLPSQINSIAVKQRIYILENSRQGVQASQLHIYNRLGLKQEMLIFSNHEDIDVATGKVHVQNFNQEFKMIKKINHQQFQVVLWNSDSLRLLGLSRQLSFTVVFHYSRKGKTEEIQKVREIKSIQISGVKMLVYYEERIKLKETTITGTTFSLSGKDTQPRKEKKKSNSKKKQLYHHSIAIFNCLTDRLIYQLQRISHKIKILHVYNSIILTREQDPNNSDYDLLRVMDIAEHGPLLNKYLFSVKLMRQSEKLTKMYDLRQQNHAEIIAQKNKILQQIRQLKVKKTIQIQQSKIAVSQSNKLLLILVFKIQTQIQYVTSNNPLKTEVEFMIYTRNISDELINRDYKISRIQIGKKTKRNIQQFQTSIGRNQDVSDHKELTFQQLCSMSNYAQIDMQILCEQIQHQTTKIPSPDLTPRLLTPHLIPTNKIKDYFQLISVNNQEALKKLISEKGNSNAALSNISFKIVQYDQQKLAGVAAISSKTLKSMILYKIAFDCVKLTNDSDQPYRIEITLQKFAGMQALSPIGKMMGGETLRILQWNKNYKSQVQTLWDKAFNSISSFIRSERQEKKGTKQPIKEIQIITNQFKLPALKIRKAENLKRKIQNAQRQKERSQRSPREAKTIVEEADNLSIMFKKWSINQSITRQRQELEKNNKLNEAKIANKQLTKILKSESDKSQRIQQLITLSKQLKNISQGSLDQSKYASPSPQKKYSFIENIIRSSEVANKNNLKKFLEQKKSYIQTTNFNVTEHQNQSRSQTNYSNLLSQITKIQSSANKQQKGNNQSKLSMYSNITKKTNKTGKKSAQQQLHNPNTLQGKLSIKLQEIQQRALSQKKQRRYNEAESPPLKRTQSTNKNALKHDNDNKSAFSIHNTLRKINQIPKTQALPTSSPIRLSYAQSVDSKKHSRSKRYKTQQSTKLNFQLKKVEVTNNRVLTENSDEQFQRKAVQKMKQSEALLKSHILPQILSTKEKLTQKMKEKRSYVKIVQGFIHDSSLMAINNANQRKNIVSQLLQYK